MTSAALIARPFQPTTHAVAADRGIRANAHEQERADGATGQPSEKTTCGSVHLASRLAQSTKSELRHELERAFTDLGAATFALAHHGERVDPRLMPRVKHIADLYAHLSAVDTTSYRAAVGLVTQITRDP